MYYGDIALGATVDIKFSTRRFTTGVPFTLAGSPAVAAYVGNEITEITAGITLSVDFDARTGLNNVRVVASSGNGFAAASEVQLVITAGTVDSVSVVGEVVGAFSIANRSAIQTGDNFARLGAPAGASVSADVAAVKAQTAAIETDTAEIGTAGAGLTNINLPNQIMDIVGSITGSLSGSVGSVTGAVGSVTAAVTVGTLNANTITATSIAADAITDAKVAADVTIASVTGAVGSVTGAVGSVSAGGIAAASFAAGAINAAAIADGAIDRATLAADTGLQTIRSNTAQAGAVGTITLDAAASAVTDFYAGAWILLTGATGVGQVRAITAYNGTTKVATIAPNWATNPDVTSTFAVITAAHVTGVQGNVTGSVASVTGAVGSVTGAVGSVTGAVGSVTGNVGGNVVGSVASVTNEISHSGTAQAGTVTSITLAAGASATDGIYDPSIVRVVSGTGAGQARMIIQYVGLTKVASVDRDWRVTPNATSVYEVLTDINLFSINEGLAQGGGATSVTLNALASSINDTYVGQTVVLRTGTGQDQSRIISAYNGTTKIATVASAWATNPAAGTGYLMWPLGRAYVTAVNTGAITASSFAAGAIDAAAIAADAIGSSELAASAVNEIADQVWDELLVLHTGIGSTGAALSAAGGSGDPWSTVLPGAYGAGTAGKIIGDNINATVSSRSTQTSVDRIETFVDYEVASILAAVDTEVAAIKVKTDQLTFTTANQVDAGVLSMAANTLTASALATSAVDEISDQVWDEILSGHAGVGSTGAALSAAGGSGDPWSTALPGAYGAGTAGKIVGDNINATISSRATAAALATVQTDTDDIQARLPAALVSGRMDSSVGAIAAAAITAASIAADAITDAKVAADVTIASVTGSVGSVTGAVGSVSGAVGSVTAAVTVGTINANTITAISIAADAITDAKVAADVTIASVTGSVGSVTGAVGSVTGAVGSVTGSVGSVTGNVGGNVVGSVASVTGGVIVTTNNDKTAYTLTTAGYASVADKILGRHIAGGSDVSGLNARSVTSALRLLRNKGTNISGTLTVTEEDDVTTAWTALIATTAGNPISSVDPV